ncbi:MAG: GNAT family N-acetyltransferase [Clostridia bacterium]|nr:GNAT family N-acetyltransferase [Clostridia bacterium]
MIFDEKQIILKDGRTAILKTPCVEDAEKLLSYIRRSCGETEFLAKYPEEWDNVSVESEEKWINRCRNSENTLSISCYVGKEVVGNCEINFGSNIKTRHRANVAIAILKEYWNLGIGSAMFKELIAAAENRPIIEFMDLEVAEGNGRAKALYEKYGFETVGERPNAFKLKDGRYLKEYFMQRKIISR